MAKPRILYDTVFTSAVGTLAASGTATGYDVANIKDWRTYTRWKAPSSADSYVQIDSLSPSRGCSAIAIVGHNLGTVGASVDVDEWTGSWTNLAGPWSVTSDLPFFKVFTPGSVRTGFRVNFTGCSAAPEVGVVLLGNYLEFQKYLNTGWDPTAERIVADSVDSNTGNFLGATVRYRELTLNAEFRNVTPAWIDSTFKVAWDAHLSLLKPFVWAWEYDSHPTETYYVRLTDNPVLSMPYDPDRRSIQLSMRGVREL